MDFVFALWRQSEGVGLPDRALHGHPNIQHVVITCNQRALALILDEAVNDRGLEEYTELDSAAQSRARSLGD